MNETNPKKVGIIRWNAIIPFAIFSALIYLYFFLFFDAHVKSFLQWAGYQALGAEVNIAEFKTSFIKGNVQIKKVELTNSENPDYNSLELSDIRFDVKWDALLRAKFVVEEIAVEGVQFMSKRSFRGKVAPPPPPSNEPGFAQLLQDKALNKLDNENKNNVLGDTVQFLKTGQSEAQMKNLESQLSSKKLIAELNSKWAGKKTEWDKSLKTLPNSKEVEALKTKFNGIKFSDFKTIEELQKSAQDVDTLIKDIDDKNKKIQAVKEQFDTDLKQLDADYKSIDKQIKIDIDTLKSHFNIPKIDAANFAKSMFMDYLSPYLQKLDSYKSMAQKYLPPKYAKMLDGEKQSTVDDSIQPHPRTSGTTYEFPIKNGYPLFWIQEVKISSKSNQQADYGDFTGIISHITSNQKQIGHPTSARVFGSFNKLNVKDIKLNALFSNMEPISLIKFEFGIGSYPLEGLNLISSKDGTIQIPKTVVSLNTDGEIHDFKNFRISFLNNFNDVKFDINSENSTIKEVLDKTLGTINKFNLEANIKGELKSLEIDIRSSLGGDMERAFQALLQNKIKEANEQLQRAVNAEIDKLKSQFNTQVNDLRSQAQGEVQKIQSQIDQQKKQAEEKIAQAKKEFDDKVNKAKKEAEENAKKQLQKEGQKQLDDLKKKLGL